jgi:hypothetical protein
MQFPLWRYGAYAFAIAATLCLAAANVAWAWSLDDGVYRYVMIAVSVAADIGAPCALMAMMHHHGDKDPTSALAAFVVWAFCGYAEVKGAEIWLKANSFLLSAPAIKATEAQKAASADLGAETANLAEIRRLMAGERREARLDALQRREKASLERIDRLRPQTFTPGVEPARSQYAGNELALALALWLLSQVAWKMAVGRLHGAGHVVVRPAKPANPVWRVLARDEPTNQPEREPDQPPVEDADLQPAIPQPTSQMAGCPTSQPANSSHGEQPSLRIGYQGFGQGRSRPVLAVSNPSHSQKRDEDCALLAKAAAILAAAKRPVSDRKLAGQLGVSRWKAGGLLKELAGRPAAQPTKEPAGQRPGEPAVVVD